MKKERKLSLGLKKTRISQLNRIKGKGGVTSVDFLCQISEFCVDSELCTDPAINCKTFVTGTDSGERC